jgi:hypothetical protein
MINVDATVFEAKNRMGIGLVAKNHKGDFLLQSDKELIKLSTLCCPFCQSISVLSGGGGL